MRPLLLLTLFVGIAVAQAQTNTLRVDGKPCALPTQFVVNEQGVQFVAPGQSLRVVLWSQVDLPSLAANEPQIEAARQEALLHHKTSYFLAKASWHDFKAFMSAPISVRFQPRVETRTRTVSRYDVSFNGYPTADGRRSLQDLGVVRGDSSTVSVAIDQTRFPLVTTIEGLFLTIGDDRNPDSSRLIRELQRQNGFFQNLLIGLRNLQDRYPRHGGIADTVKSIELLSTGTVSIDAQRQLMKFAQYSRTLK